MRRSTFTFVLACSLALALLAVSCVPGGVDAAALLSGTLQIQLNNSAHASLFLTSSSATAQSPRRAVLTLRFRFSREVAGNTPSLAQLSVPSSAHATSAGLTPLVATSGSAALSQSFSAATRTLTVVATFSLQEASATELNVLDALTTRALGPTNVLGYAVVGAGPNTKIAAVERVTLHFEELLLVAVSDVGVSYATAAAQCAAAAFPPSYSGYTGTAAQLARSTTPFLATALKPHEDALLEGWMWSFGGAGAGASYWLGNSMTDRRPSRNKFCWEADPDYDASKCSATAPGYFGLLAVAGTSPSCVRQSPPMTCSSPALSSVTVDYDTLACCNKVFGATWVRGATQSAWSIADLYQMTSGVAGFLCATIGRNLTQGSRSFANYSLAVAKLSGGGSSRSASQSRTRTKTPRLPLSSATTTTTTTTTTTNATGTAPTTTTTTSTSAAAPNGTTHATTSTTTTTMTTAAAATSAPNSTTLPTTVPTTSTAANNSNATTVASSSSSLVYTTEALAPYPSMRERWRTEIAISTFVVYLISAFFPPLATLAQIVAAVAVLPNRADTVLSQNVSINVTAQIVIVTAAQRVADEQAAANATTTSLAVAAPNTTQLSLSQVTPSDDWRAFHVFTASPLSVVLSPTEFLGIGGGASAAAATQSATALALDRVATLCIIYLIGVGVLLGVLCLVAIVVSGGAPKNDGAAIAAAVAAGGLTPSRRRARSEINAALSEADQIIVIDDASLPAGRSRKSQQQQQQRRRRKRVRFTSDLEMASPPRVIHPDGRITRADEFVDTTSSSSSDGDGDGEQDVDENGVPRARNGSSSKRRRHRAATSFAAGSSFSVLPVACDCGAGGGNNNNGGGIAATAVRSPPSALSLASQAMLFPSLLVMWTVLFVPPWVFHAAVILAAPSAATGTPAAAIDRQASGVAVTLLVLCALFIVLLELVARALSRAAATTAPALARFLSEMDRRRGRILAGQKVSPLLLSGGKPGNEASDGSKTPSSAKRDGGGRGGTTIEYPRRPPPPPPAAASSATRIPQLSPSGFVSPAHHQQQHHDAAAAASPRSAPSPSVPRGINGGGGGDISGDLSPASSSLLLHVIGLLYYRDADERELREPVMWINGFYGTAAGSVAQWFAVFDPFLPRYVASFPRVFGLAGYVLFASLLALFSGLQLEQRDSLQVPLMVTMLVLLVLFAIGVAATRPHRRCVISLASFLLTALAAGILIAQLADTAGSAASVSSRFFSDAHFVLVVIAIIAFWFLVLAAIATSAHEMRADAGLYEAAHEFDPVECMRLRGDFAEAHEDAARQLVAAEAILLLAEEKGGDDGAQQEQQEQEQHVEHGVAEAVGGAAAVVGAETSAQHDAALSPRKYAVANGGGGGGGGAGANDVGDGDGELSLEELATLHAQARLHRQQQEHSGGGGGGGSLSPVPPEHSALALVQSRGAAEAEAAMGSVSPLPAAVSTTVAGSASVHGGGGVTSSQRRVRNPHLKVIHVAGVNDDPRHNDFFGEEFDSDYGDDDDIGNNNGDAHSRQRPRRGGNGGGNRPIFEDDYESSFGQEDSFFCSNKRRGRNNGDGDSDGDPTAAALAQAEDRKFHLQVLLLSWFRDFVSQQRREPTVDDIEQDKGGIRPVYHEYAELRRYIRRERKKWMLRRLNGGGGGGGEDEHATAAVVDAQDAEEEAVARRAEMRRLQEQHLLQSNTVRGKKLALNLRLNAWRDEFQQRHGRRPTHADVAQDISAMAMYESYLSLKLQEKQQLQQQQQQQQNASQLSVQNASDISHHRDDGDDDVNDKNSRSGAAAFDSSFTGSFLALQEEERKRQQQLSSASNKKTNGAASADATFFSGDDAAAMYRFGSPRTRGRLERKEFLRRQLHGWAEEQRKVRLFPAGGVPLESDYLLDPDVGELYCQYQELKSSLRAGRMVSSNNKSAKAAREQRDGTSDGVAMLSTEGDDDRQQQQQLVGAGGHSSSMYESSFVHEETPDDQPPPSVAGAAAAASSQARDGSSAAVTAAATTLSVWRQRRRRLLGREISRWKQEWIARHAADSTQGQGGAAVEPTVSDMNPRMRALYEQYQVLRAAANAAAPAAAEGGGHAEFGVL